MKIKDKNIDIKIKKNKTLTVANFVINLQKINTIIVAEILINMERESLAKVNNKEIANKK